MTHTWKDTVKIVKEENKGHLRPLMFLKLLATFLNYILICLEYISGSLRKKMKKKTFEHKLELFLALAIVGMYVTLR